MLADRFPSPVVQLNRAVALAMAEGPDAGLALLEQVATTGDLDGYHLRHAVRGDLLVRLGRPGEASAEFERAATLTANTAEQRLLRARAVRGDGQTERLDRRA